MPDHLKAAMQIGERWGYREPPHYAGKPMIPADLLQFGPPCSNKVRIRCLDGEYPGLDQWVPRQRLLAPWEEVPAYLADEVRRYDVWAASSHVNRTPEWEAAWLVFGAYPRPDGILLGYNASHGGMVEIPELDPVLTDLGLTREALFADPLAHIDRRGSYVGPWSIAQMLARHVAAVYTEFVLAAVRTEEEELETASVQGKHYEDRRPERNFFLPADYYVDELAKMRPVFALAREWCGAASVARFDEITALRAEVARLRALVLDASQLLRETRHPHLARRLREAVGEEPEPRPLRLEDFIP